jgi:CheY-like chemotaxis protein
MRKFKVIKRFPLLLVGLALLMFQSLSAGDVAIQQQIDQNKAFAEKYEKDGNKIELAKCLIKLGNLYWQIDAESEAVKNFELAIDLNKQLGNKNALRVIYNYLGVIYSEHESYQKAIDNFEKSLALNLEAKNINEAASDYLNLASALQSLGNYSASNIRAQRGLEIALETNDLEIAKSSYKILGENYDKLGQNTMASENYEKYNTLAKHLQKKQMDAMENKTREFETQVQTKEKELKNTLDTLGEVLQINREMQLQNELLNKENQLKALEVKEQQARMEAREKVRRTQIVSLSIVLSLFIFIVILIYWQFNQKKKANHLLKEQNAEIERQKSEIEYQSELTNKQSKKITDSIQYARRIQKAVLPPEEVFKNNFKDYFVLNKPKDIVSGDFYWVTSKDGILIVAAADCTGHGVPGAFMSMLGVAYLNEIVNKIAINKHISSLNADEILNQLREMVISSLHQTGNLEDPKDGMDIALVIIDPEHKRIQYAGAYNPLYIVRDGKIIEYPADKMPVSYHQKRDVPFTRHEFDLKSNDSIYLFSDGYIDQFGGDQGMKFMSGKFRDLILKIHTLPMSEQHDLLDKALNDWRGKRQQLDDVLVIGLQYSVAVSKEKSVAQINWQSKTILIAEDTDINYFLLAEVLKGTKANLVRVKDGQEAIDFIKNNEVNLILMDINMPRMNGYEATRTIKRLRKDIPIIVQTAMHFDEESEEAFKSGADDFITKPIDLKTFMSKIEQFIC